MFHGLCFQFGAPGGTNLPSTRLGLRICEDPRITLKSHQIWSQSRSTINMKTSSKATQNHEKLREKSNFFESWFLQYPQSKMLGFPIPDTPFFKPQNRQKKKLETNINKYTFFLFQEFPTNTQNGFPNTPKTDTNQSLDLKCPFLCSSMSRIVPGRESRGIKHAKWHTWAPET